MAGEKRGLLYETVTMVALKLAVQKINMNTQIFWNKKPENMSVVPDFTLGSDVNNPTHLILVTASGTVTGMDKKFWRNVAELQEAKAQLPIIPIVINLHFHKFVKATLRDAEQKLYDTTLHVFLLPYFDSIRNWMEKRKKLPTISQEQKVEILLEDSASDVELADAIERFSQDLARALVYRNEDLYELWELMRKDYAKTKKTFLSKTTRIRHGIAKLCVIESDTRQLLSSGYTISQPVPNYLLELGFFIKTLTGYRLVDNDIKDAINLLGSQTCEQIINYIPYSMYAWIHPLRNLQRVHIHVEFVETHYEKIVSSNELKKIFIDCFNNPSTLSGDASDKKVWIFEIMMSMLKARSGKSQGYGYAQLAEDTQILELQKGLHGLYLTPYILREKPLPDDGLDMLVKGLAKRFEQEIKRSDIPQLKDKMISLVIKQNLQDRLIPYRNFEPLLWLLQDELRKQGKKYIGKERYVGWINEYTNAGKRVATTPFVRVKNTLIHWKTVSSRGRVHKKKELAGRARNLKYTYHQNTEKVTRRNDVQSLALIVDGEFTDNDFKVLAESGWDHIIYPDEIADFVKSL